MVIAEKLGTLTVEEYLSGELHSGVRHEYIGGTAYAMAGASEEHNAIAGNLFAALHAHLRGKPCRVFFVDMKARVLIARTDIFYYPDLMVSCDAQDRDEFFSKRPCLIVEITSPGTEAIDHREKLFAYISSTACVSMCW